MSPDSEQTKYTGFINRLMYVVGWRLVDMLTPGQRRSVARLLPPRQRRFIEDLLTSGEKSGTVAPPRLRAVQQLSARLWNLGFAERALADLHALVENNTRPRLQRAAAWELCVWYADQYSEEGARKCLALLPKAMQGEKDGVRLRRAAVLEAESLDTLGATAEARRALSRAMARANHADLYLAAANLESSLPERVGWINKALELHGLARISLDASVDLPPFYRLKAEGDERGRLPAPGDGPKVSVIMPSYNAGGSIRTALDSVLAQKWTNLEVLVVDDCSEDGTAGIVEEYVSRDCRVRLLRAEQNRGTYFVRNLALKEATGEFVTCHDTDDWSHPAKIEIQVRHLTQNPSVIGNFSQLVRVTPDLKLYRRGNPGYYTHINMSSFMFRREAVLESVGYWDSVRFAADDELVRRIERFFGGRPVVNLATGFLTFGHQSRVSLAGHSAFGYHGRLAGARREYQEGYTHFHATTHDLHVEFPQQTRPFAVPEPLLPRREAEGSQWRCFDIILASDFRFPGGTTFSNLEEIKAQSQMGLRTGLVQMYRYAADPDARINPMIREVIDGDRVQMVVYGEKVSCGLLVLKHPSILQEWQRYIPDVRAERVIVVMNQTPLKDYGRDSTHEYDIVRCDAHLKDYFGTSGVWYPIGPWIRETLHRYHAEDLTAIQLATEDWVEIIDVDEWRRVSRPPRSPSVRLGRHSRDDWSKWPSDPEEMLSIYPSSDGYEVRILGGAEAAKQVLGRLPGNWHVLEFGAMQPKDFLSTLDVFVYYTHPHMVEAFGRTIVEAVATGVPVVLPHSYKDLFQEAAIYAEPSEVRAAIDQLMNDDNYYESRVDRARAYVEKNFGYSRHASRLNRIMRREAQG